MRRFLFVNTYAPSLLDKLLGSHAGVRDGTTLRYSVEQVKDSVARDIEMLLNAHQHFSTDELRGLPNAASSVLTVGLVDISPMSLASDRDCERIKEAIRRGLMAHDRRLTNVEVGIREANTGRGGPTFSIRAQLLLQENVEQVLFDAVLQPGSHRYDVSKADPRQAHYPGASSL